MPYNPRFGTYPVAATTDNPDPFEFGRIVVNGQRRQRLPYHGENHMIIIGRQGSGKDTRLIIPNLLRMRGRSIVCVDPKGEMAAVSGRARKNCGRVVVLNPFGVLCDYQGFTRDMEGCGFNPLCAFNPSDPNFNKDAGLLAEAFVKVTSDEKQPFFPVTARALVAFLIMVECVKANQQGRDPQLFNVRRMLCEPNSEAVPKSKILPYGIPATGIPLYAQEMQNCVVMGLRNKAGQFTRWGKEMESVVATARAETEFLDDPQIAYCLARNDFDFRDVKKTPTTVYLVLPMEVIERHSKWLRICLTAALNACQRPRAAGEPRTLFIFNEFAAIGHLSLVETNYTVVRGAGIQMLLVLQDLNQLKQLYKERWQTFTGNADVIATFAPTGDPETAEWFSKCCAETQRLKIAVTQTYGQNIGNTVNQGLAGNGETSGQGASGGFNDGWSAAYSEEQVPLVTPLDLYSMTAGEMRIIWAGMGGDTYNAHARQYFEMENLMAETRPPDNPYRQNANIPRVPWRMPDYEGFMARMAGAFQPAPEIGDAFGSGGGWDDDRAASSENIFDQMFGKGRSSSSSGEWDAPGSGDSWGGAPAKGDLADIFDHMFGKGRSSSPAPPAPPAQQTPDNIRPNVQARHPGYTPDPPKHGGDDWVE